ncbi:flavin-dependent halogenase O-methyltransferase bifunctional protein [Grosmannia clavigera kw1407]|uniref:Flavin-dependent halogenase O-methyltransferase bifunctional protein n=1 Tax=Grosmannia clavigera (strain kw1407 / UAMH 11150) TaxID=655863 RepID=F0XE00_GROCL|nr:flavin-dependent halogenase O-methyltransferase bifunctional protein [Grosmannia clavigera kw1407]EFX04254.1 flavin-dependent halogenase O-methyltransferase bifunctional protein [Grosmannia clavigera kw1407]
MASVPQSCTVLVVGGGPGGSYASAALALEGIDVVLLEAEVFPRYHIGESMLPSMRHFLKFIGAYEKWDAHGFNIKKGGAFRLNWSRPETYTDFIAAGGPGGYAWNVIRSEADDLLFKHAADCGAKTFDGTKVTSIEFAPQDQVGEAGANTVGRPMSATWSRKNGSSGTITFDYLVDASGRAGMVSTKYLKNRSFNQGLKNIASWGYWKGGGVHGVGTHKEGAPYFEALKDASGWVWFIPLHNGTHSVGIVQNQEMAIQKKRQMAEPSSLGFYKEVLELVPGIKELLANAELVSEIKSASDWSYSASSYALPGVRIVGDAGAFIDPFFSSGVHLALSGALSAAATIAAAIRGDCDEETASSWHDKKTAESYTRFLVVVSSALKQIRSSDQPVLHDFDEESFEKAFELFRPVIQGQVDADTKGGLTQAEISKTLEFCFKAFAHVSFDEKEALINKLKELGLDGDVHDENNRKALDELEKELTPEERAILTTLKGRRMIRPEDSLNIDNFTLDSIDGLAPRLERGKLGLAAAKKAEVKYTTHDKLSYLNGEARAANKLGKNDYAEPQGNSMTNGHKVTNGHNGVTESGPDNMNINHVADLVASWKQSSKTALDELTRHGLMSSLHEAAEELETPYDTLTRLVNAGRQVALVKLGGDLGIFKTLAESKTPLSSGQLAEYSMAEPLLVARIVRYLVANRLVYEVEPDRYVARKATYALADPHIESSLRFFHTVSNPSFQALPDYLRETGYRNQTAGSALQKGLAAEQGLFPWLKENPDVLGDFQHLMSIPKEGNGWDVIPLELSVSSTHQGPMLVDIGGNTGQQARLLVAKHPELAGRVIVQDREETIKSAPEVKGVQLMAHDFFGPQPVRGARYYYLRAILHNWDEDHAVQILANIVPAMTADSLVLIDEVVIPNKGAHVWPAGLDLQMLTLFGGSERTALQWDAILEKAGLKPVVVKKYAPVMESCVIFAARK